jgi:hypothetical protein
MSNKKNIDNQRENGNIQKKTVEKRRYQKRNYQSILNKSFTESDLSHHIMNHRLVEQKVIEKRHYPTLQDAALKIQKTQLNRSSSPTNFCEHCEHDHYKVKNY